MAGSSRLSDVLDGVAARMLADFEMSASINHRGSKGTVRESGLRTAFLDKYLPRTVAAIGSGEVVAVHGRVSRQCDILIVDPATPPLWDSDDYRVVPAECVDAVLEVKSNLTVEELRSAWANIASVKALPKVAYREDAGFSYTSHLYGRDWDHGPVLGFIFGYSSSNTIARLAEEFALLARNEPDPALRVDAVFVLNRGMIVWRDGSTERFKPTGNLGDLVVAAASTPGQVLMGMVSSLNSTLVQAHHRMLDIGQYISPDLGDVVQVYSSVPLTEEDQGTKP